MIKESEKKPATPITNPDTSLEVKKSAFISVPYVPGLSEDFRRVIQHVSVQDVFNGANILNLSLCTL